MSTSRIPIILATAVAFGCSESSVAPITQSDGLPLANVGNPVVHRVSAGGPDVCAGLGAKPGCDANFSLVALERADGSVTGQWHDQFVHPLGGIHVAVNCLDVDGNEAWIGGVITLFTNAPEVVGQEAIARVRDNGVSANDPADELSFTNFGAASCHERPDLPMYLAPQGQVVVR